MSNQQIQTGTFKEHITRPSPLYPTKTTVSHISFTGYSKSQFLKKDQQNLSTTWIDGGGRKEQRRGSRVDFTLPNLPGATASPKQSRKKNFPEADCLQSNTVTPAYRYLKAKRKYDAGTNVFDGFK
ncbi:hypothetical protein WA026_000139 [Henosepilachna vigintioctopunctata]|uniref:Uncharacterized protein n=1 Tax=Henosepilachna vigintioctopunctata TaxID=420089 RepID=A0AAW1UXG6_9CUCU